jgi:ribonuclease HI
MTLIKKPAVTLYTDGACKGNPGPGGWGAWLIAGEHQKELFGGQRNTTNNQMEMTAVIEALSTLKRSCHIQLYTDSQYVMKGMTEWMPGWVRRGWRTAGGDPVKNAELWQRLAALCALHEIDWHWVKGHAGHEGNEKADELANRGVEMALKGQA